jgi:dienelactone hydrolase
VGSLAVFALLTLAAFVVDDNVLARWMQPLSNLGIFLAALCGLAVGRPFVREYAAASVDERTARTDGFATITRDMTVLWVAVFAAMTVVSAIPPIVDGDATLRDSGDLLSILCYWVLPYVLLALGGLVSGLFPPWFEKRSALVEARETAEAPRPAPQRPSPPDLAAAVPTAGDWAPPFDDAPIAAMRFAEPEATPDLFVPPSTPWRVTVQVEVADGKSGGALVRRTVERVAGTPDARRVSIAPEGPDHLPGLLVLPPGTPPAGGWPAVVCFGGSEGGFASQVGHAELLAAHGFAALAACWISEEAAATAIASVPLECFAAALHLLADRPEVDAGRVAAMAVSRGAEGLLAAASANPSLPCRGLVPVSPSSLSWQAIGGDGEIPDTPSWSHAARPVPWRAVRSGELMGQLVRNAWRVGRDRAAHRPTLLRLRAAYARSLRRRRAPHPAGFATDRRAVDRRHRPRRRPRGPGRRAARGHGRCAGLPDRADRPHDPAAAHPGRVVRDRHRVARLRARIRASPSSKSRLAVSDMETRLYTSTTISASSTRAG